MQAKEKQVSVANGNPFCVATVLDEQGREIPITEEMIMHACDELMKLWQYPQQSKAA